MSKYVNVYLLDGTCVGLNIDLKGFAKILHKRMKRGASNYLQIEDVLIRLDYITKVIGVEDEN